MQNMPMPEQIYEFMNWQREIAVSPVVSPLEALEKSKSNSSSDDNYVPQRNRSAASASYSMFGDTRAFSRNVGNTLNDVSAKWDTQNQDGRLNTSFSGVDTKMSISFPGGVPIYVGEAQTVTYSLYTPVEPVYVLGSSKPNGFVRGQRTIAGSVIFTVFDRNVLLNAFYNAYHKSSNASCINKEYTTDELPPFDIHLSFMNEYGISAALVIEGCSIPTEGQVHSVEDMITENTMQYVARDIKLMKPGDMT